MRFIADAMLGRLAKWLRLLGFDTLYFADISDRRLLRIGMEEDRIILTRDTRLIERRGIRNYILLKSNDPFQQLIEVIDSLKLKEFNLLSRCVNCNGLLSKVRDKNEIKDSVPEFVFLNCNTFMKCNDCGKVYWEGTHPEKFRKKLSEILK